MSTTITKLQKLFSLGGRRSKINARSLIDRARQRKLAHRRGQKKQGMPGDHCWASHPQTMVNTQGLDC